MARIQVPLLLIATLLMVAVNGAVVVDRSRPSGALTVGDGGLDRYVGATPAGPGPARDDTLTVDDLLPVDDPSIPEGHPPGDVLVPVPSPEDVAAVPSEVISPDGPGVGEDAEYTTQPVDARTTLDREHYYEGEPVIATVDVCNNDPERPARYEMTELEGEFHLVASNHRGEDQVSIFGGTGGREGEVRELAPAACIGHRFVWDRTRNGQAVDPGLWEISAGWRGWQFDAPHDGEPPRLWVELHDVPRPDGDDAPVDDDRDHTYDVTIDLELDKTVYRTGEPAAFMIRLCNVTDEDLTWEYAENLDRPVSLHLYNPDNFDAHGDLRNGYEPARGETVGVKRVRLPADGCLSWNGVWKQTRGQFEMNGHSAGDPFGPGNVIANVVAEGHCLDYDVRHPDDEVHATIE